MPLDEAAKLANEVPLEFAPAYENPEFEAVDLGEETVPEAEEGGDAEEEE